MDRFRQHFAGYDDAFVLIGGAACDLWFARVGEHFRATKDIDLVLVLEAVQARFTRHFWAFIRAGGYQIGRREDGRHTFYRFSKPVAPDFPAMLELLSTAPAKIKPAAGQHIVPLTAAEDVSSLSAILMDPEYYRFILEQREVLDGLPLIKPAGLIVLKARAWLDLSRRRAAGAVDIRTDEINKHRTDVFRLATLLPAGERLTLPVALANDLTVFLAEFPVAAAAWADIRRSLAASRINLTAAELIDMVREFYGLVTS